MIPYDFFQKFLFLFYPFLLHFSIYVLIRDLPISSISHFRSHVACYFHQMLLYSVCNVFFFLTLLGSTPTWLSKYYQNKDDVNRHANVERERSQYLNPVGSTNWTEQEKFSSSGKQCYHQLGIEDQMANPQASIQVTYGLSMLYLCITHIHIHTTTATSSFKKWQWIWNIAGVVYTQEG